MKSSYASLEARLRAKPAEDSPSVTAELHHRVMTTIRSIPPGEPSLRPASSIQAPGGHRSELLAACALFTLAALGFRALWSPAPTTTESPHTSLPLPDTLSFGQARQQIETSLNQPMREEIELLKTDIQKAGRFLTGLVTGPAPFDSQNVLSRQNPVLRIQPRKGPPNSA